MRIIHHSPPHTHAIFRLSSFVVRLFPAICLICGAAATRADDDLTDLLHDAKPAATAPAPVNATEAAPIDPFHSAAPHLPPEARTGSAILSNAVTLDGHLWTTASSPLRLWQDGDKTYKDIEWSTIKKIEVIVDAATMEKDWRWLQEGSDQKIYSGKSYPLVELRYTVTLSNDQTITGGVVAPVYLYDGKKVFNLALYKKFKGTLDQTLDDVTYIKSLTLTGDPAAGAAPPKTTKLPLISD